MPEIPDIGINKISTVQVHSWTVLPPVVNTIEVPVTVDIGTPIVLMPGCVKSHPLSSKSNSIQKDDPNGVKTYCGCKRTVLHTSGLLSAGLDLHRLNSLLRHIKRSLQKSLQLQRYLQNSPRQPHQAQSRTKKHKKNQLNLLQRLSQLSQWKQR